MSQQLMDFEETKRYLKLTKSTFYRLLQNNQIPASKIGRQWRFKKGIPGQEGVLPWR